MFPTDNPRTLNLIRAVVIASSVLLMLPGAWGNSVTVVEFAHLPAGLAAWQRHSLGVYRVCGPLSKFLYALPAYLAGVRVDAPASFDADIEGRREWELGQLFQSRNQSVYHDLYRWSRLLPMLATVLGGCLICEWSTRLFGAWPGIVSLSVWCWMPPVLAHGSLVTSDVLSAVVLVASARCFWAFLLKPRPVTALLAGLTLGLAEATKFTLLVVAPCWAIFLIVRGIQLRNAAADGPDTRPSALRLIALGFLMFLVSVFVIDVLYFFQDVGFCLSQWRLGQSALAHDVNALRHRRTTAWLLQVPLPIPMEFLRGLDFQMADTERLRSTYLLGRTQLGGWWYWYAAASLFKVPLPALVLSGLVLVRLPRVLMSDGSSIWAAACLLVPATEVALVISAKTGTGTSAAFRYLIPSLALLCVWVGDAASTRSNFVRFLTVVCLIWLGANAVTGVPDHLGWQNELGQSCSRERPALIGDSLDWEQDLARLSKWVAGHASEGRTLVCVYGLGGSEPYGLTVPAAGTISSSWEDSAYLAVGENILFGYDTNMTVEVAGQRSSLNPIQQAVLLRQRPFARVGRTIRIYRVRDLDLAAVRGEEREPGY